ncbi:MAG: hypothetical protein RMJ66_04645 [Bacteroidia bacterium]|nr:hypothetical protein [Bacteroidia bacterium]MDW8134335.1 hypothetical protein [Bacteroidia bacterium]
MKKGAATLGIIVSIILMGGCGASRASSTSLNDTYATAKDRAKSSQKPSKSSNSDIDAREDNYDQTGTRNRQSDRWEEDNDYCYSCRIRRYSTGVWYDPWMDPWCGWGRSAWISPGWGWSYTWGWAPGWYYTPGWGWTYYAGYWGGPYYYAGPAWTYWGGYDPYWGGAAYSPRRTSYIPRPSMIPKGSTTYTPPRNPVVSSSANTPPRRTAQPSSPGRSSYPSYSSPTPPSGGGRPSMVGGSTGGGGVRSGAGSRPR